MAMGSAPSSRGTTTTWRPFSRWQPSPREYGDLVVRGGIGVSYDQINMNPFLDFRPPISGAGSLEDKSGQLRPRSRTSV